MTAIPATSLIRLELTRPLAVQLFKEHSAPPLAQEPVRRADFAIVASESWRDGCLRAGHPDLPLSALPMRLAPILVEGSDRRCAGFRLELSLPDGKTTASSFTIHSLRHVADRAMAPLLEAGFFKPGEISVFEVVVEPHSAAVSPPSGHDPAVAVSFRSAPLSYLKLPLRALLDRATPVALRDDALPPVFYTREALEKSESCARRGEQAGVETGGALFGSLAVCPDSGEFFSVIHDVVEVQEAEEKKFSLTYSSQSWQRLRKIQQARQAAFPQRADRLVGQTHLHPFLPNNGQVCAECWKRPTCTLSSAWASEDDQVWHRAVFARQPWALCHIFGLSARGESVHQLFGLNDGRLRARGFYVLPEFPFD
jgi:hypothetical protein